MCPLPFLTISQTPWVCGVWSVDLIEHKLCCLLNPFLKAGSPVWLAGAATSIIFVATKVLSWQTHLCHDKTHLLSQWKYTCRNKTFVATKLCLSQQKLLSWQAYFCRDKWHFYHNKHTFVMTKVSLLQQNRACCNKSESFVATKVLSQQKCLSWQFLLWQAYFCHDKRCVLSQHMGILKKKYTW